MKGQFYCNECKTKSENKNMTNEYRFFLESNFSGVNRLFVVVYFIKDEDSKKCKIWRYYFPKGITKNCNFIINGKIFYVQPIDFDVKRFDEIRKLTTGQVMIK